MISSSFHYMNLKGLNINDICWFYLMEYILESGRIIKEWRLVDFSESDLGDLPPAYIITSCNRWFSLKKNYFFWYCKPLFRYKLRNKGKNF